MASFYIHWLYTYNKCLQQQRGVDLALQRQLPYTAASCGCHTSVAVFGKDSPLLECSQCKSAYFITAYQYSRFLLYISLLFVTDN